MSQNELPIQNIKSKIYKIRGKQVMLDRDLAELYEIETRNLNKAVKRNINRFPQDFMFQLSSEELNNWKFQIGTSNSIKKGLRKLPFAFTEQGIAMLSGVLRSEKAVEVNIAIMRAFIAMRKFITHNLELFKKIAILEENHLAFKVKTENSFEKLFKALESKDLPKQGIFFNGQVFDAHVFVSDLIKTAEKSIILIDNYVDEKVLTLLSKKKSEVEVYIYSKNITNKLRQDSEKFNTQYKNLTIKHFDESHDRFLIIDNQIYHIGASLKDLGNKWFAFSRFEIDPALILNKLG